MTSAQAIETYEIPQHTHELSAEEKLTVKAISRDIEALQNQLRGVLRYMMMVRGIKGNASLSEDGCFIIEQP